MKVWDGASNASASEQVFNDDGKPAAGQSPSPTTKWVNLSQTGTKDADPLADEDWSTDLNAQQAVLSRILQILKTDFEEHTWRSFWLFAIEAKTTADISRELNMSAGAIRQARSKVRKRLAAEFHDLLGEPAPIDLASME